MKIRFAIVVACLLITGPQNVEAGSLIQEHLATVRELEVRVLLPQYKPLPGTRDGTLQKDLDSCVSTAIGGHGLVVSPDSPQRLLVEIYQELLPGPSDSRALFLLYEFGEPVELRRGWRNERNVDVFAVTWSSYDFITIDTGDFRELLMETVHSSSVNFATTVSGAKMWRKKKDLEDSTTGPNEVGELGREQASAQVSGLCGP